MKRLLALFLFVSFIATPTLTQAQEFTLKWGAPFASNVIAKGYRVLSINSNGITMLTMGAMNIGTVTNVAINHFDANLNLKETKKIQLKVGDQNLSLEAIVNTQSHILIFSTLNEGKAKRKTLYYQEFDPAAMALVKTPAKVMEVGFDPKPFAPVGSFDFRVSPDSGKIAIIYNPPAGIKSTEKFNITVLDDKLETVYQKNVELGIKDNDFTVKNIRVSNDGDVFFAAKITSGPPNPFKKETNYRYEVLMVSPQSDIAQELKVNIGEHFINVLQIGTTPDNYLVVAGFYSDGNSYSVKGCFSMQVNPENGEVVHKSIKDFPLELVTAGMTEKQADKVADKAAKGKDVEMENFILSDLIMRSDNGIVLVGEQSYSVTYTTTSSSGYTSSHTTYYANDIILIGISKDGEIDMMKKILKKQKSDAESRISYVLAVYGDKLYFIFTDNALNLAANPKRIEMADFSKKGITTLVTVDKEGQMTRKKLYGFDKFPVSQPSYSLPLDDGTVILVTTTGFKCRLCLVTLE